MKKLIAILVALAMAAMLSITAFAENENMSDDVSLTKTFQMPEGVVTPNKTFTFDFVQDTTNGNANAVAIPQKSISFTDADEGTTTDGLKTINKAVDILDGIQWVNAAGTVVPGKYVYTVTETQPTGTGAEGNVLNESATDPDTGAVTAKKTTYSTQTYTMEVIVNNQGQVVGVVVKDSQGNKVTNTDPTEGQANGFNFLNKYSEKVTNTPSGKDPDAQDEEPDDDDGASAFVEKTVTAAEGFVDDNQAFAFSTTVDFAKVDPADAYYAKVINKDGSVDTTQGATVGEEANVLTFTDDTPTTYTLKNGQRLVFTAIDLGAKITTTETELADYDATYSNATDALVTKDTTATKVTNAYNKSTTPTGILISNLPYIALALVAIGGLVAYVVVRRRQSDEA